MAIEPTNPCTLACVGFAASSQQEQNKHQKIEDRRQYCKETAMFMLGNANAIAEVIVSALAPNL